MMLKMTFDDGEIKDVGRDLWLDLRHTYSMEAIRDDTAVGGWAGAFRGAGISVPFFKMVRLVLIVSLINVNLTKSGTDKMVRLVLIVSLINVNLTKSGTDKMVRLVLIVSLVNVNLTKSGTDKMVRLVLSPWLTSVSLKVVLIRW